MKKILLLQEIETDSFYVKRFLEEANSDIEIYHTKYSDLTIEINSENTNIATTEGTSIFEFDAFVFRSSRNESRNINLEFIPYSIKYLLNEQGKVILNYKYTNEIRNLEAIKLHNYFVLQKAGLPIINTKIITNLDHLETGKIQFPKILKPVNGSMGKGIQVVNNKEEFEEYVKTYNINDTLIQDLVVNSKKHFDVRIICVGKKILGGMKRVSNKEGSFLTNFSLGNSIEKFEIDSRVEEICLKTMESLGLDYAGIDIIFDENDKPYLLEVNSGAQFEGFEKITGTNVAKEIIEYLLSKLSI